MLQCVHPHLGLELLHARVRDDCCADIIAAHAARGAVGHDLQVNAAANEVETAADGANARCSAKRPVTDCAKSPKRFYSRDML